MSWFSGSRQPRAPEPKESLEHRSLALPQLLRRLHPEAHPSLLDLGMAVLVGMALAAWDLWTQLGRRRRR